jgi:hypothetical protein
VVYETFSKEIFPFVCEKDVHLKWIAGSIFFVTIWGDLYEEYKKDERTFDEHTGKIISAMGIDALEQLKNFIRRLTSNEAQGENCRILRSVGIPSHLYETAAECIPANKIGISAEDGRLNPLHSERGLFCWAPFKKKIKN